MTVIKHVTRCTGNAKCSFWIDNSSDGAANKINFIVRGNKDIAELSISNVRHWLNVPADNTLPVPLVFKNLELSLSESDNCQENVKILIRSQRTVGE